MAVQTTNKQRDTQGRVERVVYPMSGGTAGTNILEGMIVAKAGQGYAVTGSGLAGFPVLGVATEAVDNQSGAPGAKTITLLRGPCWLPQVGTISGSAIGQTAYCANGTEVGLSGAASTLNKVGEILKVGAAADAGDGKVNFVLVNVGFPSRTNGEV